MHATDTAIAACFPRISVATCSAVDAAHATCDTAISTTTAARAGRRLGSDG